MASMRTLAKTAVFSVLVPGTVAVAMPRLLAVWRPRPRIPLSRAAGRIAGAGAIVAGVVLYLHTAWRFATDGRGTPSPTDEPAALVTGGSYAHIRNPMYVAVLLIVVGQALVARSVAVLWWAVGCWIGFHNRVVGYEEPHLAETHGEEYDRYRERVPRWIPRWRRKAPG